MNVIINLLKITTTREIMDQNNIVFKIKYKKTIET